MAAVSIAANTRSEEHTSELQSRLHLVCRLLLEKKTLAPKGPRSHGPPPHYPSAPRRRGGGGSGRITRSAASRGEGAPGIVYVSVFFFNDTATTEIYTLSLHDALPI